MEVVKPAGWWGAWVGQGGGIGGGEDGKGGGDGGRSSGSGGAKDNKLFCSHLWLQLLDVSAPLLLHVDWLASCPQGGATSSISSSPSTSSNTSRCFSADIEVIPFSSSISAFLSGVTASKSFSSEVLPSSSSRIRVLRYCGSWKLALLRDNRNS